MTDEPENRQQNQPNGKKRPPTSGSLKKGYDPRRWLKGRGPKSPEQREGEEILRAVYWKELSREFDARTGKPLTQDEETLTTLEIAVRNQIKKQFDKVADRIAGAVTKNVDIKSDGKPLNWKDFINGNAESDNKQP